jgi:hypothetical protein
LCFSRKHHHDNWECWKHPTQPAPTRHFVVLSKVWFFIVKYIGFEAYPLLTPKCRVGAGPFPSLLGVPSLPTSLRSLPYSPRQQQKATEKMAQLFFLGDGEIEGR